MLDEHGAEENFGGGSRSGRVLPCELEVPCSINQEPACSVCCQQRDAGHGQQHEHPPREKDFTTEGERQLHLLKGALSHAEFVDSDLEVSLPKAMVPRSPRPARWPDLRLRLSRDRCDKDSRKASERISADLAGEH